MPCMAETVYPKLDLVVTDFAVYCDVQEGFVHNFLFPCDDKLSMYCDAQDKI